MIHISEQFTGNLQERSADTIPNAAIADLLRPLVSEERLAANALTYPHMQEELTDREGRQIEAIKARLVQMPLVHGATNYETMEIIKLEGLKPIVHLGQDAQGSTFSIDRSLGLDQYVFLNWGKPDELFYGSELVEVDTEAVLANSVVTPKDIIPSSSIGLYKECPYSDLPEALKAKLDEEYFGRMVTGQAWLDITAVQVLRFAQRMPGFPFPVGRHEFLGEVKHLGPIDPNLIKQVVSLTDDRARSLRNARLMQNGIAFDTPETVLQLLKSNASFNPRDAEAFQRASWDEIMAIE